MDLEKEANATKNSEIGDVIRNTDSKVRADGRSDNVQKPADSKGDNAKEIIKVSDKEVQDLFDNAMKGDWDKVLEACKKNHEILKIRITNSEDRALHIAVADGRKDIVSKLVDSMGEGENAKEILTIKNEAGNTALHLAAALGNAPMCHFMASKDPNLVAVRNKENETPLFLAARHGMEAAFRCLQSYEKQLIKEESRGHSHRAKNGDNVLHAAISGEHLSLAFKTINLYPNVINLRNTNGSTPLHILAKKPNVFKSNNILGLFDSIIYYCISVDEVKMEEYNHQACENDSKVNSPIKFPRNRETLTKFFRQFRIPIRKPSQTQRNAGDEENPQNSKPQGPSKKEDKEDKLFQNIFATCFVIFRGMALLIIALGLGISKIKDIIDMKERHTWANQVMNELADKTGSYKYEDDSGRDPKKSWRPRDDDRFPSLNGSSDSDNNEKKENIVDKFASSYQSWLLRDESPFSYWPDSADSNNNEEMENIVDKFVSSYQAVIKDLNTPEKKNALLTFERKDTEIKGKKDTAILIAAKLGVTEMVQKMLDKFPVSSRDLDSDKKNIALLAIENRQVSIFKLLLNHQNLRKSVFQQLDSQGNSALHLAAKYKENRPWRIPGAALQMQWEIKWYQFVKKSLRDHILIEYNFEDKTPKDMFTESHKYLVQEGREWLTKTSESCSVVAALIATVAFATSTTVPGGVDQGSGKPILKTEIAFNVFALSSLVALSFSITALVFFLTILTSRYQEHDFARDLPRKLLIGLTTLFTSIVSILISFCCGHSFILTDDIRSIAIPIYAATCLPMTFFALAQLPLYIDLIRANFKMVPQRSYVVNLD